jgi:hypothetical protein
MQIRKILLMVYPSLMCSHNPNHMEQWNKYNIPLSGQHTGKEHETV